MLAWPLTPADHPTGRCPVRIPYGLFGTTDQVVQLVDTRRSERRAHTGLGVRLSPWSLEMRCRRGWRQTGFHKAGVPVRFRGLQLKLILTQVGQCPVKAHNLRQPGATPGPATCGRVRKLEKRPAREAGDFVGSTPTSATCGPVVKRHDTSPTCWKRWFNSIRDHFRHGL